MYAIVKQFLEKLGDSDADLIEFSVSDNRVAMAVLLFRVITVDGLIRDAEMARYRELLQDHLNVTPDELDLFEQVVRTESNGENGLYSFTTAVSRLPQATKRHILDMMRDISISDNELHEFEINLVARTAELLELPLDE